jgi:methionyl-tRNA formyltransferase
LHDKLADLGAQGVMEVLRLLQDGKLKPERQDSAHATYAAKLSKAEARIDWRQDAQVIERAIRGYIPFPVAYTTFNGTAIKLFRARVAKGSGAAPGTVIAIGKDQILVQGADAAVALELLQKPGGKILPPAQFAQGFPIRAGDRFDPT